MRKLLKILLAFSAVHLWAQGYVQVSSLIAEPTTLDCRQQTSAKVTAQIYFYGIEPAKESPRAVTLRLGIYSATPSVNRLEISDENRTVPLEVSPAVAKFEVVCTADTKPGEIKVVATILTAPVGAKISLEPLLPAVISIAGATPPAQKLQGAAMQQKPQLALILHKSFFR